jgi:hypothetical protein
MEAYAVNRAVNSPHNDGPECVEAVEGELALTFECS